MMEAPSVQRKAILRFGAKVSEAGWQWCGRVTISRVGVDLLGRHVQEEGRTGVVGVLGDDTVRPDRSARTCAASPVGGCWTK